MPTEQKADTERRWEGWPVIEVEGYEKHRGDVRPKSIVERGARLSDQSLLLMTRTTYVPFFALEKEKAEREAIVDAQADRMEKEACDPQLNEFARQQAEYDAKLLRRTFAALASQETDK